MLTFLGLDIEFSILLNRIRIQKTALHTKIDRTRLVLTTEGETEGIDGEYGELFRAVGESEPCDEGLWIGLQLVLLNLLLGETTPEADVDHDVPSDQTVRVHSNKSIL